MPTEIRIYYEGDRLLKEGLNGLFSEIRVRAAEKRCKVRFIPAEGTPSKDFGIAIRANTTSWNILLLDSEGPDNGSLSASLCAKKGWGQAQADSIFWMVEMMESWFHTD